MRATFLHVDSKEKNSSYDAPPLTKSRKNSRTNHKLTDKNYRGSLDIHDESDHETRFAELF
jgi:hypothetical protein